MLSQAQAIELAGGPFSFAQIELIKNASFPVGWTWRNENRKLCFDGGTGFVVQTGTRLLGITAKHVVEGYEAARASIDAVNCQFGNLQVDLSQRVIGRSLGRDIASFELTARDLAEIGDEAPKVALDVWPSHNVVKGDRILFGGFPGESREQLAELDFSFGFVGGINPTQSADARDPYFRCVIDPAFSVGIAGTDGMIPPNFPFNGMSGGPALRVFGGPVSPSFQLAGVIHEGSASFACIDFHRLDTLQPDGTFTA